MIGIGKFTRQRLWTLLSVLPIVALAGLLLYAYVLRPRLERRAAERAAQARSQVPPEWQAWRREAAKMRPDFLGLLSPKQRKEIEDGVARYYVDLKDLPKALRDQLVRAAEAIPANAGQRVVGGKIEYRLVRFPGQAGLLDVSPVLEQKSASGIRTQEYELGAPPESEQRRRGRFQPQPEIMHRLDTVVVGEQVPPEEFQKWWEQAKSKIAPLAGPPKYQQDGEAYAYAPTPLSPSHLAALRDRVEYLLRVVPRPGQAEKVVLGQASGGGCSVRYTSLDPSARITGASFFCKLSALSGLPPTGFLAYQSQPVGGTLMIEWKPEGQGFVVLTQMYIR